jgi:hypothetical protein
MMLYIIGEIRIELLILYDRLRASWKSRRWISDKEYYEVRRGN